MVAATKSLNWRKPIFDRNVLNSLKFSAFRTTMPCCNRFITPGRLANEEVLANCNGWCARFRVRRYGNGSGRWWRFEDGHQQAGVWSQRPQAAPAALQTS